MGLKSLEKIISDCKTQVKIRPIMGLKFDCDLKGYCKEEVKIRPIMGLKCGSSKTKAVTSSS